MAVQRSYLCRSTINCSVFPVGAKGRFGFFIAIRLGGQWIHGCNFGETANAGWSSVIGGNYLVARCLAFLLQANSAYVTSWRMKVMARNFLRARIEVRFAEPMEYLSHWPDGSVAAFYSPSEFSCHSCPLDALLLW